MAVLFDLFPLLLFFLAFKFGGLWIATSVLLVSTLAQMLYSKIRHGKIDTMLWVSGLLVVVLGGATLLLKNPLFIQWKPTVLYGLFASALLIADYGYGNNLLEKMLREKLILPPKVWRTLTIMWSLFFIALGILNIYIAKHYSQAVWVNFKVFGILTLMLCFIVGQGWWLKSYLPTEPHKVQR